MTDSPNVDSDRHLHVDDEPRLHACYGLDHDAGFQGTVGAPGHEYTGHEYTGHERHRGA